MERVRREVLLKKFIVPVDTDGDNIVDSLVFTADTINLLIHLTQTIDDIGIYSDTDIIPGQEETP